MYANIKVGCVFTLPESRLFALSLLTWDSAMSARSSASSSSFWTFLHLDRLKFLELLLATLHGQVLSLIQAVLQVLNCNLQVLLHPLQVRAIILGSESIIKVQLCILVKKISGIVPAPDLRIQSALHGVNHPLAVPLDLLHLFILLCQLPVYFTLNLVELQLDTQNLRLFMFQSSLMMSKKRVFISAF
uniref:Uncharacterized protein n=1 Tax=Dicentrarchus labrax TaxID=13489 RepID=A0A8P4KKZ7_DICLA